MKHITFYLDFVSPYAWLAYERLPDALEGLSYSVSYKHQGPIILISPMSFTNDSNN